MSWSVWMSFVALSAVNIVTPGPANLNTLRRAMQLGFGLVVPTILGNALGLAVAGAVCAAGVGAIVVGHPLVWGMFRWGGVGYLAWLGLRLILGRDPLPLAGEAAVVPAAVLFREAFLLAATNPKALLFFVALFPQVLSPEASIWAQSVALIATYCALSILSLSSYAALAHHARDRMLTRTRYDVFCLLSGAVLIGVALSLAL